MKWMVLAVVALTGCESEAKPISEYENAIIVEYVGDSPAVTPVAKKHKREDCPTGGWVGDGTVRTRCLDCEPAWTEDDAQLLPFGSDAILTPVSLPLVGRLRSCAGGPCAVSSGGAKTANSASGYTGPIRRIVRRQPVRSFFGRRPIRRLFCR